MKIKPLWHSRNYARLTFLDLCKHRQISLSIFTQHQIVKFTTIASQSKPNPQQYVILYHRPIHMAIWRILLICAAIGLPVVKNSHFLITVSLFVCSIQFSHARSTMGDKWMVSQHSHNNREGYYMQTKYRREQTGATPNRRLYYLVNPSGSL